MAGIKRKIGVEPAETAVMNPPNFRIRKAVQADLGLIERFIRELAAFEKLEDEVVLAPADLEATLFGSEKCAEVLLAFVDDQPAGIAIYFFAYSTFTARPVLYLEDLFVQPHLRSRGTGKALFKALIEIAHEKRCGRFEWSVLDWNKGAIGFYEQLGAKPLQEWVRYRLTSEQIEALACTKKDRENAPGLQN